MRTARTHVSVFFLPLLCNFHTRDCSPYDARGRLTLLGGGLLVLLVAVAGEASAGMDEPVVHCHEMHEPPAAQFLLSDTERGRGRRSGAADGRGGGAGKQPLSRLELLLLAFGLPGLLLEVCGWECEAGMIYDARAWRKCTTPPALPPSLPSPHA